MVVMTHFTRAKEGGYRPHCSTISPEWALQFDIRINSPIGSRNVCPEANISLGLELITMAGACKGGSLPYVDGSTNQGVTTHRKAKLEIEAIRPNQKPLRRILQYLLRSCLRCLRYHQ